MEIKTLEVVIYQEDIDTEKKDIEASIETKIRQLEASSAFERSCLLTEFIKAKSI